MKINSFTTPNISFQNNLVASCAVIKEGASFPCKIFELEEFIDKDYFQNLKKDKDWRKNYFLDTMHYKIKWKAVDDKIFVLEDEAEKCLGYVLLSEDYFTSNKMDIIFLETCPAYIKENNKKKESQIKYVGETLLSFIARLLKGTKTEGICIPQPSNKAIPFYIKNCGFERDDTFRQGLILKEEQFNKLINKNEEHTGSSINIFEFLY